MGFLNELKNVFHAMADTNGNGELNEKEKKELEKVKKATNTKIVPTVEIDHKQAQKNSNNQQKAQGDEGKGEK